LFLILTHLQQFVLAQLLKLLDQVQVTLKIVEWNNRRCGSQGAKTRAIINSAAHIFGQS
jgi:hypothetical protein